MSKLAIALTVLAFTAGTGLVVAGIYVLQGLGWALITASVPFLVLTVVLVRGMARG